jgi:hypothetical protein
MALTRAQLKTQQAGIFATMPNTQAAFEYAQAALKAEGADPAVITTAIMVYHNTLIEQLKQYCPPEE